MTRVPERVGLKEVHLKIKMAMFNSQNYLKQRKT